MKYRLHYTILGLKPFYCEVSSPEEANSIINALSSFCDHHINTGLICDHCSVAGLEVYNEEDHEWEDWYDDDGRDFNEHFNPNMGDAKEVTTDV